MLTAKQTTCNHNGPGLIVVHLYITTVFQVSCYKRIQPRPSIYLQAKCCISDKASGDKDQQFTKLKPGQKSGKRKSEAILDDNDANSRCKRSRQDDEDSDVVGRRPRRYTRSKAEEPKELRRSKRKSTHGNEEVKGQESSEVKVAAGVQEKDEATLKAGNFAP